MRSIRARDLPVRSTRVPLTLERARASKNSGGGGGGTWADPDHSITGIILTRKNKKWERMRERGARRAERGLGVRWRLVGGLGALDGHLRLDPKEPLHHALPALLNLRRHSSQAQDSSLTSHQSVRHFGSHKRVAHENANRQANEGTPCRASSRFAPSQPRRWLGAAGSTLRLCTGCSKDCIGWRRSTRRMSRWLDAAGARCRVVTIRPLRRVPLRRSAGTDRSATVPAPIAPPSAA